MAASKYSEELCWCESGHESTNNNNTNNNKNVMWERDILAQFLHNSSWKYSTLTPPKSPILSKLSSNDTAAMKHQNKETNAPLI